jgi:hypothetical protein
MYIVQEKTLKDTRTAIQARHGFEKRSVGNPSPAQNSHLNPSIRSWKTKVGEWGYSKYIKSKGKKRKLEGRDIDFHHGNNRIPRQRNQKFKRRKIQEVSPSVGELLYSQCFSIIF